MKDKIVLAIDPGTAKLGMAVVRRDSNDKIILEWRAIVQRANVCEAVAKAQETYNFELVIVGSGTQSRDIVAEIRQFQASMAILVVDETDTTMQARERYWEHNPRRGWRKFWPATLQVPPDPVDDYVALILAERVLAQG